MTCRARRQQLLEKYGGVEGYLRHAQVGERLKASGRPIAKLPKKAKQRRKKTG